MKKKTRKVTRKPRKKKDTTIDTNEILVPNWFNKKELSELVESKISNTRYKEFKKWIGNSSVPSEISAIIYDCWKEFKEEKKNEN